MAKLDIIMLCENFEHFQHVGDTMTVSFENYPIVINTNHSKIKFFESVYF